MIHEDARAAAWLYDSARRAATRQAHELDSTPAAAGPLGLPKGAPATSSQKLCSLCIAALHGGCVGTVHVPSAAIATSVPESPPPLRPTILRGPDRRARAPPVLV